MKPEAETSHLLA